MRRGVQFPAWCLLRLAGIRSSIDTYENSETLRSR
jgi:hypothetical protein